MWLAAVSVKVEPGGADGVRIKDEVEWSGEAEGAEGAGGAEHEPRRAAGELGHYPPPNRTNTLCAPRGSPCAALRDHTYASTEYPPADECVKKEPSCSASEWADLYAEHAVKDEFVLGPECVQRPRARVVPGKRFYPSESAAEPARALAVGAGPARKPRGSRRALRGRSARLRRAPPRRVPPARARAARRHAPARAHGDSDIEHEIYTTVDYDKDPVCDMCGRRFALKVDLMRHVVVHIHTPTGTEQEKGSGGGEDDDLPRFLWRWARLVPRECVVRLERCGAATRPQLAASRPQLAATRPQLAATRPQLAATRPQLAASRPQLAATRPQLATTRPQLPATRPQLAATGPQRAATRPPHTRETFLHNVESTYECDICKRRFTLKRYLILHMKMHSPNISQVIHKRCRRTNGTYACECKKEFSEWRNLLTHLQAHAGGKPYACDICNKRFQRSELDRHRRTHTGEKPFSCGICKRKFSQLGSLRRHKSIVHDGTYKYTQGTKQPSCDICNKLCASSSALHIHKQIHTGVKRYFCDVCKKRFTQSGDLNAHKRIHTGEKPFPCEICNKSFRKLNDLCRHKRVHTGEKPHCCKQCGKKFYRLYLLRQHICKSTAEKPLSCKKVKRGRPRKRRTSSHESCVSERDDMDRKKTRDRDVLKKENCDHKQVGGQVDDETNLHDTNGRELNRHTNYVCLTLDEKEQTEGWNKL